MTPLKDCVFCNGKGWFWGVGGKQFECYCVSIAKRREETELTI